MFKKVLNIFLILLVTISVNYAFNVHYAIAAEEKSIDEMVQQQTAKVDDKTNDVLQKPFPKEEQPEKEPGKISSLFIKGIAAILIFLFIAVIFSFVFIAKLQRTKEERQKKLKNNSDLTHATDDFARHRMKNIRK
ncbi:MAG: hypothetical protein PHX18_03100 [Candidatus Gastranaerophilales bacterium]|nr:hypothetical protein [Candidatus Gastranaerophilales bacterium]